MNWKLNALGMCGVAFATSACATDDSEPQLNEAASPLVLTNLVVTDEGLLEFDADVPPNTPTTNLKAGERQGFEFDGKAGGRVTITMKGKGCSAPDTFLYLFGPENISGDRGASLVQNDDAFIAPCNFDSQITNFLLPTTGTYLIVATSFLEQGGGRFTLSLRCNNNACKDPNAATFAASRLTQAQIEARTRTPEQVFENGDFLFEHIFRLSEGFGNGLTASPGGPGPKPNMRDVHEGAFGAPEALSCLGCHNVGGDDGAGGNDRNIFQIGNGVDKATGLQRNPPHVLGLGYRQALAREMTTELQAQRTAGSNAARAANANRTVTLTSKTVSFGSLIARPDGTFDNTGIRGIDADLVVKPLGWKGREQFSRRFAEGGFRVHFGMQTQPSIIKHCAVPVTATFGTGANCQDPDADGIVEEISEGQLTSIGVYLSILEVPVDIPASTTADQALLDHGKQVFGTAQCNGCHVVSMNLINTIFNEPSDSNGPGFNVNLKVDTHEPRPAFNADGSIKVVQWSDFKRHDMGTALADSKPFGIIGANQFVTTPLWGVAGTAPYMHDGRSVTIHDAILAHAGEGLASRNLYAALPVGEQLALLRFLKSLGRIGDEPPNPRVDMSQFQIFQNTTGITVIFPAGFGVPHGGYAIVGRNATKAQFEAFWGKTLPANVSYFNSAGFMPVITGGDSFRLRNANGITIDGPTFAIPSGARKNLRRNVDTTPDAAASWTVTTDAVANATPGGGQPLGSGTETLYISEISDASNSSFEFIEVFVE